MAKKLYFDIETLPAPESSYDVLKYLYARKQSKLEPDSDKLEETFEEFVEKTSFDGTYGRILCIAYAVDDKSVEYLCNPDDERETLEKFWDVAAGVDLFIGHNIMEFDLKFIMQRSAILGVKPSWNKFEEPGKKPWELDKFLSFARYRNNPIFDTMYEWSNWGRPNLGLEHIALAMGIPTPKEGIDGSEVNKFFKEGKIKEVCEYCMRDVETTRAVYKKMTFHGVDNERVLPF